MLPENPTNDPVASGTKAPDAMSVRDYWRTIVRRRWLVLAFFVATVVITTVLTLRQTKIYDATCTIIIDVTAPRVLDKDQVQEVVESGAGGFWFTREYYETQYRVITSRAVAQRVADKLQLASNAKFLGVPDGSLRDGARPARDPVGILQGHLKVEPVKESRVVRIRYEDPDPELAAIIANTIAESYVAETLSVRTTASASASDWLEQQLADLERKLETSGKALYEFKKAHDIVAASWDDRQSMISQRLTSINGALTTAQLRKAELQARNEAIQAIASSLDAESEAESLHGIANSQAIQALKMRYLDTRAECADLKMRYLRDHPRLEECEKKLALAKQSFEDQVKITLDAARKEYEEVAKTEKHLAGLLSQAKTDAFALNQYERDYLELKRANDNNQRLYDLVLKRLKDTGVAGMLQSSNVRILDRARPSQAPVRPSPIRNLIIAIVLGLIGGVGLAFGAEYLVNTISTQEQIEQQLKLAFLGVIPRISSGKEGDRLELSVHAEPKSAAAECLRAIRTNILFMMPEKPLRTLLVTSSGPQEGKTTASTSVAIAMAGSGNRVLIVDADMRRPRLHRVFGVPNNVGLSTLTVGQGDLASAVRSSGVPNVYVLPSGPIPPNPAELLHTAAFRRLVEQMGSQFDRVILDSPPVGAVADALVMATVADGCVFVARAGRTSRDLARRAVRHLRDVNAILIGAVLNDLDIKDPRYGYYTYYYHGYADESGGGSPTPESAPGA